MRVSGKLQVHRVVGHVVRPVRLVSEQDHWLAGRNSLKSKVQPGLSVKDVIYAGKPKPLPFPFEGHGSVAQDRNLMGLEDLNHVTRVGIRVVIAESSQNSQ